MNATDYTFRLSAYDIERLVPQVSKALEKRTELVSRNRFPALWKLTDKLSSTKGETRRRLHTRFFGILCLLAGIFLLVPGLTNPEELRLPLILGILAVLSGAADLWRSRGKKPNPFDTSARTLLNGKDAYTEEDTVEISFFETAMMLPGDGDDACVLYDDFKYVIEEADIFLLVFDTRAVVLQKKDLTNGNTDVFRAFITANVSEYHSLV